MNKRQIGFDKESLAIAYLESQNYQILERNWHYSNKGEIDIIAIDPVRFQEDYLVFIEVKYRSYGISESLYSPNLGKQKQIKKLALYYLKKKLLNIDKTNISFDFIAISNEETQHIKNIFY